MPGLKLDKEVEADKIVERNYNKFIEEEDLKLKYIKLFSCVTFIINFLRFRCSIDAQLYKQLEDRI